MMRHAWIRGFGFVIFIIVGSMIAWNVTFLLDYVFHQTIFFFLGFFSHQNFMRDVPWFPYLMHFSFMILVGVSSVYFMKSVYSVVWKALFLTIPTAVILVTFGILLYQWPYAAWSAASVFVLSTLVYLYMKHLSWQYFFAVLYTSVVLGIFTFMGGEL